MRYLAKRLLLPTLLLLLVACSTRPLLQDTTIETHSQEEVTVTAYGGAKHYAWRQRSGIPVDIIDPQSQTLRFLAPTVTQKEILIFALEARYENNITKEAELSVIVLPPEASTVTGNDDNSTDSNTSTGGEDNATGGGTADSTPPVITLRGDAAVTLTVGDTYTDAGATAIDDEDGDISTHIHTSSTVDTAIAGTYTVTYTVSDAAGNTANTVTRIVTVVVPPDTTAPVITLLGEATMTLEQHAAYVEPGATAIDDRDGNVSVKTSGTVDTTTVGTYTITYTATDSAVNTATATRSIKIIPPTLTSIHLESNTSTLYVGEQAALSLVGTYTNGSTNTIDENITYVITPAGHASLSAGRLTALEAGTITIQAKVGTLTSNLLNMTLQTPVLLTSLSVSPNPIALRAATSKALGITAHYSDGSSQKVSDADFEMTDTSIATMEGEDLVRGVSEGSTTLKITVGSYAQTVSVIVAQELNTTNFNFTHFGNAYIDQIPLDATLNSYDEKRFCMIAGQILAEDGSPLPGVKVSIHKHPEYGTKLTDDNGTYTIPAEGGLQLTMRYTKEGYTTIDRQVQAPVQDWVRAEDVTMLTVDTKVTTIDLNSTTPQIHISTPVTDDRGGRSTTLVFDGVTKATVTAPDGSTRELTGFDVRATEFKTPESMPGDLPRRIGFTYCSDIKVDGVSDDESVTFDAPVVMYVENFIGFPAGGIVPVGYYDRNQARWIGSKNGIVIKLLDTDGDGIVDALDSNDSGTPNDLDGDGSFTDEVAGIAGNAKYKPGETFWRVEITHFTPWDHNWPWPDGTSPDDDDVDPDTDSDVPNDCTVPINSYVTSKSRIFHEDIPIAGTNQTLHYSSKRTQGYKHIVTVTVDTSDVYTTVWSAIIRLSIGGRIFEKEYNTGGIVEAKFEWDGLDAIGRPYLGNAKGTITVGYRNLTQYLPPKQEGEISWGKAVSDTLHDLWEGGCLNCSIGWRILWGNPISVQFYNEDSNEFGHGWSVSNHDRAFGDMLLRGDGSIEKKRKIYSPNKVKALAELDSPAKIVVDSKNNIYVIDKNSNRDKIKKIDSLGTITTIITSVYAYIDGLAIDKDDNIYYTDTNYDQYSSIRKLNTSDGTISVIAGTGSDWSWANTTNSDEVFDVTSASLENHLSPIALVLNRANNLLYFSGGGVYIGEIDLAENTIRKIAGIYQGSNGLSEDGGLAFNSHMYGVRDLAINMSGELCIAETWNHRIRKIDKNGILSTLAGTGSGYGDAGFSGDGRFATEAYLNYPFAMTFDSVGDLYIADTNNGRIRIVNDNGIIGTTLDANSGLDRPKGVAFDLYGNLLISDASNGKIWIRTLDALFKKYNLVFIYKNPNNTADIFDASGKHIKTIDLNTGKSLKEFGYDENNRLITITDQFNQTTTITRDANGNPTSITAPDGQVTTLTVDENGDLIQVGYEDNSHYTFVYDGGSLMTQETDPNGNLFVHAFDADGRIVKDIDAANGVWKFAKSINGKATTYTMTKPEGEQTVSVDSREDNGTITSSVTYPSGDALVSTTSYDGKSVTTVRDGVTTVRTYGADSFTHQKMLTSVSTTQPSGLKQTSTYTTAYDGNETHTNTKTQSSTINGKTTTLLHDYNNGTETLTTPAHRVSTRAYDILTRLTSKITIGSLLPTTYSYDTKGRLTTETTGDRETGYTYDSRGNLATITDPRGQTSTYTYDIMDRLTTLTHPNGTQEHFTYDANGNLLTRTVPTPADHVFAYNGVDARTSTTSPLHKTTTYTYDKSRHLTQVTKPSGKTITHTYTNGRLTSTTTDEGTTAYSYLFADKVDSITKGSESFSFTYDGTLLTGITQSGMLNQTIGYSYNNDFLPSSMTYAGVTENYGYDNDGLVTASGAYTLTRDTANGFVTTITDGTLTQHRSYNSYGEITQVSDDTFTYELSQRDKSGAITQKRETLRGATETFDYSYDEMGRLTEVKRNNTLVESYTYDANGNRASATINGTTTTASYTLDDQLVVYGDNAYRYDDDGYLTEKTTPDGTTTYSYGTMGELLSVSTPAKTITYKHNALNQRAAKLVDGQVVEKYLWANLTTLLAVYDADDTLIQRFEYADQRMPIAMTDANHTKYYLHYDQVGSLRAVSDTNHNIIKELTYDTFGNILTDSNPSFKVPFGFAGGLYDPDTKLTRFGYRDYDAYTGKWTAKDPIGFAGGDSNLYGYVLGDPVNFVDSVGLEGNDITPVEPADIAPVTSSNPPEPNERPWSDAPHTHPDDSPETVLNKHKTWERCLTKYCEIMRKWDEKGKDTMDQDEWGDHCDYQSL